MKLETISTILNEINTTLQMSRSVMNISLNHINTLTQKYKCCNNYVEKYNKKLQLYNNMINMYNDLLHEVKTGKWILNKKYNSKLLEFSKLTKDFLESSFKFDKNVFSAVFTISNEKDPEKQKAWIKFVELSPPTHKPVIKGGKSDTAITSNNSQNVFNSIQKITTNMRYPINIAKNDLFRDPIMLTEDNINIGEYIANDVDNIVLMYGDKKYFFTKRSILQKMYNDKNSVFYGCYVQDTGLTPKPENVSEIKKYLSLKSIGLLGPNNYSIVDVIFKNLHHQLFYVYNLNYTFGSFTSEAVFKDGDNVVSALHCQEGHKSPISVVIACYPSVKDDDNENQNFVSVWNPNKSIVNNNKNSKEQSNNNVFSVWGNSKPTGGKKSIKNKQKRARKIKTRKQKN